MATRGSSLTRKSSAPLLAGLAFVAFALLAGTFSLNRWPVTGDDEPAVIHVKIGDHCRLIPSSCGSLTATAGIWFAGEGSITTAHEPQLWAVEAADDQMLSDAVILIASPPPRSA